MKIRQKIAGISVLALGLAMAGPAFAEDAPDYDPQLDLGSGVTVYTVQDFQGAGAKAECLAGVKKWRQDALDDNVKWPNPDSSTTMRQYLAENGVSETEYLAPKWSQELERITMERVAETAVHGKRGHYRSNDESIFSLRPNAPGGMYEIIAWHVTGGCTERIDQWAGEKEYWVNQTDGETGHYETLIDPDVLHYGFAGLNDADTLGNFISPSVWVGQGFSGDLADESAVEYQGKATIPINITEDAANQGADLSQNEMMVDETATLKATTKAHNGKAFFRGDWTSSDPAIASITKDGVITGVSGGTVTLTLTIPEGNVFTFPYTVKAAQIVSVADPAGVTTESGTAPVLPDMVTATYDDDSVKDVEVTWDAIDEAQYSAREGGQFTVNGTVAGWDNPVTITVTVNPATITGVDPETTDHTVESGEKPELPETTTATWSNGDTTEETITWDE
ncbi:MAG: Ig-like domain-containing protein, partial [Flaviflexus sp.]|nr:Ig-like domain-containing protein [Flaviflexus sp.]